VRDKIVFLRTTWQVFGFAAMLRVLFRIKPRIRP
jgi:hypothetical protein